MESGREELKKEREIMQLVAGLQLSDEERREVPPHVMRARHAPRYGIHVMLFNLQLYTVPQGTAALAVKNIQLNSTSNFNSLQ